ncbi:DUF2797 domain-containing protein, partial [Leptospira interrogans serovar Pomona]|nr:DUF2797 domain-containing protein [Leptospira interrogans serovar Pomona]
SVRNRGVEQGAVLVILLLDVCSRSDAGIIEKELSKVLSYRHSCKKLVSGYSDPLDHCFSIKSYLKL